MRATRSSRVRLRFIPNNLRRTLVARSVSASPSIKARRTSSHAAPLLRPPSVPESRSSRGVSVSPTTIHSRKHARHSFTSASASSRVASGFERGMCLFCDFMKHTLDDVPARLGSWRRDLAVAAEFRRAGRWRPQISFPCKLCRGVAAVAMACGRTAWSSVVLGFRCRGILGGWLRCCEALARCVMRFCAFRGAPCTLLLYD